MGVNPATIMDCYSIAHMPMSQASSEALLNACATIKAAEIQADAAIVSGWDTLISGYLAFSVGAGAVLWGIYSAGKQAREVRRTDLFKQKVFITKLEPLMRLTQQELINIRIRSDDVSRALKASYTVPFKTFDDLLTQNIRTAIDFMSFEYISQIHSLSQDTLYILSNLNAYLGQILNDLIEIDEILRKMNSSLWQKGNEIAGETEFKSQREQAIILCSELLQGVDQVETHTANLPKAFSHDDRAQISKFAQPFKAIYAKFKPTKPLPPA